MRLYACYLILVLAETGSAQTFHPDIPKAWDDQEVARFETPLAQRDRWPVADVRVAKLGNRAGIVGAADLALRR